MTEPKRVVVWAEQYHKGQQTRGVSYWAEKKAYCVLTEYGRIPINDGDWVVSYADKMFLEIVSNEAATEILKRTKKGNS